MLFFIPTASPGFFTPSNPLFTLLLSFLSTMLAVWPLEFLDSEGFVLAFFSLSCALCAADVCSRLKLAFVPLCWSSEDFRCPMLEEV